MTRGRPTARSWSASGPRVCARWGRGSAGPVFEVCVDVVEPLGDEVLVHGSVAAPDGVAATEPDEGILAAETESGRASVIVRLPPEDRPATGSLLRVAPAPNALRLFDPASGRAIRTT